MARYASVPIHFVCTRVFFLREEEENRETFQMSRESGRSFVRFSYQNSSVADIRQRFSPSRTHAQQNV